MKSLSKLCDAADWFDPEVDEIIRVELREPARLHRKQWEFAMIFLVLRRLGMVRRDTVGLSLGGGIERLMYALANNVRHMTVTDLYDPNTSWDCARTDNPDEFVRSRRPFDVDDSRYNALRMDMRSLEFPERVFDFCYSSCAIEHIGDDADFIRHFNEVARVLKDNGIYVLTTEVSYLHHTIRDPNNYVFSPDHLADVIADSDLVPMFDCDAAITRNSVNAPLPWEIIQTALDRENGMTKRLLESIPHITLLRGQYPFGSGLLVLRKRSSSPRVHRLRFTGLEHLHAFMEASKREYREILSSCQETFASPDEQKALWSRSVSTTFQQMATELRNSQMNADMRPPRQQNVKSI